MKIAVISDIHGNLAAFLAVLKDLEEQGAESIYCLGDIIGYGPDPQEVVDLVREKKIPSVIGNHELGVARKDYMDWFNPIARKTLSLTKSMLSRETISFLEALPQNDVFNNCLMVHGCPPNFPMTYLFERTDMELFWTLENLDQRISFVGHTHCLEIVGNDGRELFRTDLEQDRYELIKDFKYIVNVGSVGQPRDGDNNAKYVIWDDLKNMLEVRYVPYDIKSTADKILALGWPEFLAKRLY